MKRLTGVMLVVALVAIGGGFYAWKSRQTPTRSPDGMSSRQTTATVESRDIKFAITVAGEIGPAEQVSVRPEVNGRIAELPVDIGDRVKKDALLFALDDKDLQIELDTRKQEIASEQLQLAKASLRMKQAERDFERDKSLYQEKLVSEQVYETTKQLWDSAGKDHELAANSVQRARTSLALTEEKLTKTRVKAPFDCTVLTRPISAVGQAVSGSGGFNSGTEVMTIANLADLVILAHVNQADVTRLRAGMEVRVAVEAVAGLTVTGLVERLSPQATIINTIKGFSTRIRLKTPDERVQPGMTANITIPVASSSNVFAVPLAAVFTEFNQKLQQNERYVYVASGETFSKRSVRIGVADYFFAEVQHGVQAGDVVALEKPAADKIVESAPAKAESQPGGAASTSATNT
ncbi:MAG: efflux RND transporter periplasmic adaptor subunit [Opitutaceae bacterium]|nr:efflux RND transporter periplasmic adaptor subunit [Verrucomicrobiales bacterium]